MRPWFRAGAAAALALASAGMGPARHDSVRHLPVGLILRDNVLVHTRAATGSTVLTSLVQQTQVEVLANRGKWDHVRVWTSVDGWVPKVDVGFRRSWNTTSTYRAPEVHYHLHSHDPQSVHANARTSSVTSLARSPHSSFVGTLAGGAHVQVTSWQQDSSGAIWYRIGKLWAPGETIQFDETTEREAGSLSACACRGVAGKGMWLTLGTLTDSSAVALVKAAIHVGMTHLYVEAAISPLGFHGRRSVGHLLAAAHRSHLAVIAWVYPYLYDLAADVALTRTVAAFRTTSGERFDGIAADLERNMTLPNIRAYSQLIRAYVGPRYLLVGVTYPPRSLPGFPFAEAARSYDVIAPMDYWHQTTSDHGLDYNHMAYGYAYGYRYAQDSVKTIRTLVGNARVAPIGQAFDNYGRLEMGPHAPSSSEIRGFLAGGQSAGAIGASFFQWMTTTLPEWREIRDFHF